MFSLRACCSACSRNPQLWESLPGKTKLTLNIFANDWLLMVARNIMPLNPISIIVVQNCHARLGLSVELDLLSVVRLLPWWSEPGSNALEWHYVQEGGVLTLQLGTSPGIESRLLAAWEPGLLTRTSHWCSLGTNPACHSRQSHRGGRMSRSMGHSLQQQNHMN